MYQYFSIREFIQGFFLQNTTKLRFLPPDLVLTVTLMTPKVLYMATRLMQVVVLYLLTHHLSILFHCRNYLCVFPSKYHKLRILPPDLVLTEALMTPKLLYMATRVMQVDMLYLLTHHLSIFFHCRIYLWGFPSKYH